MRALIVLLVACTAIEPSPEGLPEGLPDAGVELEVYKGGTRLKAKMLVSADGAKMFQTMHDTMLGEDCTFQTGSDGVIRCYPKFTSTTRFFADAECTVPLVEVMSYATSYKYVSLRALPSGIPSQTPERMFTRGTKHVGNIVHTAQLPTLCDEGWPLDGRVFDTLGNELPAATFVSATYSIE